MSNCKTIAVCNQKGGVGKTTTTVNLGIGLAMQGKKVLLIDADPQGDLTTCLGWRDTDSLSVTLTEKLQAIISEQEQNPFDGILQHKEKVDLVPSNLSLSSLEMTLVTAMSRESVLKNYLSLVKDKYDYVLIDCMPSLGIVLQAVKTVYAKAKEKNITITFDCEQNFEAMLDFNWTAEAITNILDNAVKYTPSGGIVGLEITEYPSYLRLDISDNGIGIPEEEQAKIFGRFYRGKQSAGIDGVGIGLYLTRDIINKQKGYIKVASDENGSVFSLFLKKD